MRRCKYCHRRCWPWQSYSWELAEVTDTDRGFILVHATHEKDIVIHDSCFFLKQLNLDLED